MDKKQKNINIVSASKTRWVSLGTLVASITYSHPDTHALERALQKKDLPEKINTGTFSGSKRWLIQYLRKERKAHSSKKHFKTGYISLKV